MQQNMSVLLSCDIESCSKCVSVELRKGTCFWSAPRAAMTSPKALRDLLMFCASFRAWPVALDLLIRSEPAKSTKCNLLKVRIPEDLCTVATWTDSNMCERDECSFMSVEAAARTESAMSISSSTCAEHRGRGLGPNGLEIKKETTHDLV